jgi:hypothetical protein
MTSYTGGAGGGAPCPGYGTGGPIMECFIGKIIKGRVLKQFLRGATFVKITNGSMKHHGLQLQTGLNIDKWNLSTEECSKGGLYFTTLENMFYYADYGNGYHEVSFDDNENIFIERDKFKARRITLGIKKKLYDIPEKYLDSIIAIIAKDPFRLNYFPESIRHNKQIIDKLIALNPLVFCYCSDEMKNNEELAIKAITLHSVTFAYCSDELKNNENLALIAVSKNGMLLRHCSDALRNNKKVVQAAILNYPLAFVYCSDELKQNKDIKNLQGIMH